MALTLAQAELYSTNQAYRAVVEIFTYMSPIFGKLSFEDIVGNAFQYVRESTRSSVAFRDPEETWTESQGTVTQVTTALKILGGDVDVDEFLKKTRSNYVDIVAHLTAEKVRELKKTFLDTFYYGSTTVNAKEFSGLHTLMDGSMDLHEGSSTTGDELTFSNLDALIDLIENGSPDCLIMPKAIRRRINAFIRATGGTYMETRDEWGNTIQSYNTLPIYVDDSLVMTETIASDAYATKTGGSTGSIFAVRFGNKGVFGIQNGTIETKVIGQLEDKDAARTRVRWYVGLGLYDYKGLARLDGITDAAAEA